MSEQHSESLDYPEFSITLDCPNDQISDDVLQKIYGTAIDDLNRQGKHRGQRCRDS